MSAQVIPDKWENTLSLAGARSRISRTSFWFMKRLLFVAHFCSDQVKKHKWENEFIKLIEGSSLGSAVGQAFSYRVPIAPRGLLWTESLERLPAICMVIELPFYYFLGCGVTDWQPLVSHGNQNFSFLRRRMRRLGCTYLAPFTDVFRGLHWQSLRTFKDAYKKQLAL